MKLNFTMLTKVIQWIPLAFKAKGSIPVCLLVDLVRRLKIVHDSRGVIYYIAFVKAMRANLFNYLSKNDHRDPLSACTSDGIPMFLKDLIPLVRGRSYLAITMILTVLMATRSLKLKPQPDTESITASPKGNLRIYSVFARDFWRELGYRPQGRLSKLLVANSKTYRVKAGPNGHALSTSLIDAQALPDSLVNSLKIVGGPLLTAELKFTNRNQPFLYYFLSKYMKVVAVEPLFRKLSYFPDKEGKTRVIGILDWFSQLALKPLHTYLLNALKKIPQDCTLDQSNFLKSLKNSKIYYSVDLSNATDRFPIDLICQVLKAQLPDSYVDAWKDIMVGYPFKIDNSYIHYATGNPMGAYSSFNSFAFTHHYLVYYCCRYLGKDWKSLPYALLGDDIVIGDPEVGEKYMEVIQDLGLEYSPLKTHRSKDFFEFAKRYFLDGVEISPFPFSALKESHRTVSGLTTLLFELMKRNFEPEVSIESSLILYYGVVRSLPSKFRKKLGRKVSLCEGVLKTIHGLIPVDEWINSLIKKNNYRLPVLSPDVCRNIMMNVTVQVFADSNLMKNVNTFWHDYPLTRASATMRYDFILWKNTLSKTFVSQLPFADITDTPFYTAWLAVKEMYEKLLKDIETRDKLGEDWIYTARTFALPRTDKSILSNERYEISKISKLYGDLVEEQLQILQLYPQLIPG